MSTCPKCGGYSFSLEKNAPLSSNFYVYFVQCSSCGTPVGVLEYANSASMLEILTKKVDDLASQVHQLSYDINQVKSRIR